MNSNLNGTRSIPGEGWAALVGVLGSAVLLAKKLLSSKPGKVEHVSRAEFYAESLATRERLNATHIVMLEQLQGNHLALLEKLDSNHREVLAGLERQGERIARIEGHLNADCGLRIAE